MSSDRYPDEQHEPKFDLSERFPDLRPISTVPGLSTVNGIGTAMVGSRDFDAETSTYVKTRCFTVLFIPVIALGSYRVFDANGGGWCFLGQVPLSGFARGWNWFLLLLVLAGGGGGGWFAYTNTEEYRAGTAIARADKLAGGGQATEAAAIYRDVLLGNNARQGDAKARLTALIDAPPGNLTDTAGLYDVALDLLRREQLDVPDLFGKAIRQAEQGEKNDLAGALALLEVVTPLAQSPAEHAKACRRLLEQLVAKSPEDVELASRLAVVCERLGDANRCLQLLLPLEERLGDREGAAVLGRALGAQGKYEQAVKLLSTYLDTRLPRLRAAEQEYVAATRAAEDRVVTELREDKAAGFDSNKARAANTAQQNAMVADYVARRLRDDPAVHAAQRKLAAEARAVPAALDLGAVRLQLAQGMADPAARQAALKQAEETFLAVQRMAGESDKFRMNLGQVYYWLGRGDEGRKLFDDYLNTHSRASEAVCGVANTLREVGATSEARKLLEEAYPKESDPAMKETVALLRSIMATDLDDKILWLGRSRQGNMEVKANLAHARGQKAARDGKDDEAARHFREALAEYAKMPLSEARLNNSAGVHYSLFQITQDREQLRKGADNLERALAMRPGDSILMANVASSLSESIARDLIGDAIDLKAIKRSADFGLLPFLYADQAGKEQVTARLREHPSCAKLRGYFDRLTVLAPKRASSYASLSALCNLVGDLDGMRAVVRKIDGVKLDLDKSREDALEAYAGKKDDKNRTDWEKAVARQRETLTAARKAGGRTLAVAASGLASSLQAAAAYGVLTDTNEIVKLAEEANASAPSSGTKASLAEALLFRAHLALKSQEMEYAAMANKTSRSLGHQLLGWALCKPGPVRDKALANADVRRAVALKLAQEKAFPSYPSLSDWPFLAAIYPEEAAELVKRIKADEAGRLRRHVDRAYSVLDWSEAMEDYYRLLMDGKAQEAETRLREEANKGIPLPVALR